MPIGGSNGSATKSPDATRGILWRGEPLETLTRDQLIEAVEYLGSENEALRKCGTCGTPLSRDCPSCKRAWES